MMDRLIAEMSECVEAEYIRASVKYGPVHASDHESYAILLEELQEAMDEVDSAQDFLEMFWTLVKGNDTDVLKKIRLSQLQRSALLGACELIQVAAMAKKASLTIERRVDSERAQHDQDN